MRKTLFIIILLIGKAAFTSLEAQYSFHSSFNSSFLHGVGDSAPLWFYARQEGRWHNSEKSQFLSTLSGRYFYRPFSNLQLSAKAEIDYNNEFDKLYLHTGYLSANWHFAELRVGRHTFDPIFEKSYQGQGSFLFGDNSRPVTRITVSLPRYTSLPFSLNKIQVKGGISHGWLNDKNEYLHHNKVLLHEKYAYIRWNGHIWKPYAGLNHSALLGGYYYSAGSYTKEKIPVDFIATFFGSESSKIGGGEETNAAGGHMGLYDIGFYKIVPYGSFRFYFQLPFSDASGMKKPFIRNKDQIIGINWQSASSSYLSNITIEWAKTSYQSGNGTPDAMVIWPDGSGRELIVTFMLDDEAFRNNLMKKLSGNDIYIEYTKEEVVNYLRDRFNRGKPFGGRDGYMNNGMYPAGWSYYDMIMGSPLSLSYRQLNHLKNEQIGNYRRVNILNDRYKAIHIGARGDLNLNFTWEAMLTYSLNYGSYYQQYSGRYTWDELEDYFFKGGKKQLYSMIGLSWKQQYLTNLELKAKIAVDNGEIYRSKGIKFEAYWFF